MNIVVLAGGISTEREISIVSGTQVCKALRGRGHRAVLLDVFCGDGRITEENAFPDEYDVDAAAAYARSFDGQLEELKKRRSVFGPNVLDKDLTKQLFRENGVPTPKGIVIQRGDEILPPAENKVGLPCVVKPACGGSSVGVSIARTEEGYKKALETAFSYEDVLIVEQYIRGREFSVGIVDGIVYPVIEIAPLSGFYDYVNKYKAGSTIETCPADIPAHVTEKMQQACLRAYHALRLSSYGRIDVMMDEEENVYCLEANTLPGMTPTSLLPQEAAALGIDFPALCEKLIEVSVRDRA